MSNSPYGMHFQPLDVNGNPYPLATMHCLSAGTAWPAGALVVYSDYNLATPAANPVVADANGVFPVRYLANATAYKFIISKADGTVLWTDDNVYGAQSEYVGQVNAASASATPAVTGTNTSSGPAIKAVSSGGAGHAIWVEADTSSPVKAAVHIVPQDNAPSSPVKGDLWVDTTSGKTRCYDGTVAHEIVTTGNVTDGIGCQATGKTTHVGGRFDGGPTAGDGLWGVAGAGGASGVVGYSSAGGDGVRGEGGAGAGVKGIATTGQAGYFNASGAGGTGVAAISSAGYGAVIQGDTTSPNYAALRIVPQNAAPSSPAEGDIYYNSTTHHLMVYLAAAWAQLDP